MAGGSHCVGAVEHEGGVAGDRALLSVWRCAVTQPQQRVGGRCVEPQLKTLGLHGTVDGRLRAHGLWQLQQCLVELLLGVDVVAKEVEPELHAITAALLPGCNP
ncbi:hypothetical protein D3C72_1975420 [compost metagenome]